MEYASQDLARTYGEPRNVGGRAQPFIVLGMGKLGGGELNFSSDIDLIFVFPDKGTTSGAPLHRQRGFLHAPGTAA